MRRRLRRTRWHSDGFDRLPENPDAFLDCLFAQVGIAEEETVPAGPALDTVAADPVDAHTKSQRLSHDRALAHVGGQPGHQVQARRLPNRLQLRDVSVQRLEECVAPAPVDGSHTAQVVIELAVGDEVREGQLVDRRRTTVGQALGCGYVIDETPWQCHPAESQPGRQSLARRADVDDTLRRQPLEGSDRRPIVAILGVVVVLDDEPVSAGRPGNQCGPPFGRQDAAQWKLVRRRDDDGLGVRPFQATDVDARVVDWHPDDGQSERFGDLPRRVVRGILESQPSLSRLPEHLAEQRQTLVEAGAHDDLIGLGRGTAHAIEVGGQGFSEFRNTSAVEVVQPPVGRFAQGTAQRP